MRASPYWTHTTAGEESPVELWRPVSAWVEGGEYWDYAGSAAERPAEDAVWQFLFNGD